MALLELKKILVLVMICGSSAKPASAEPIRLRGPHFHLICHVTDRTVADEALKTLEATWPLVAATYQVSDRPAKAVPTVHLYSTAAQYEEADRTLSGGAFRENLAFTNYRTNSGHVLLQPPCSDAILKIIGLPAQSRRLLAHEAVHLVAHALVDQYETLPQWIIDGAATSIAQAVMIRMGHSESSESDPFCSTYIHAAGDLHKSGRLPKLADIMAGRLERFDLLTRYGLRWLCYEFIHNGVGQREWGAAIQQSVKNPRQAWAVQIIKRFLAQGADDRFAAYVKKLKPQWQQVYRSLETAGTEWLQTAFPDKNAICWQIEPMRKSGFEISGQARILPGPARQLNLLLGKSADGFISIAMVAGYGVTVFRYSSGNDEWTRLGDAECAMPADKPFQFRVHYRSDKLTIFVNDTQVLRASVPRRAMNGTWGLGAQAGTSGIWSRVRVSKDGGRNG